ncbi:MAG: nuclear transport factor 2 family protein [Deltaproteobacteria bacterium]|nr:nuclear transport factor 2 family protein [Deltaproteobacteria bacterium]
MKKLQAILIILGLVAITGLVYLDQTAHAEGAAAPTARAKQRPKSGSKPMSKEKIIALVKGLVARLHQGVASKDLAAVAGLLARDKNSVNIGIGEMWFRWPELQEPIRALTKTTYNYKITRKGMTVRVLPGGKTAVAVEDLSLRWTEAEDGLTYELPGGGRATYTLREDSPGKWKFFKIAWQELPAS